MEAKHRVYALYCARAVGCSFFIFFTIGIIKGAVLLVVAVSAFLYDCKTLSNSAAVFDHADGR